MGDLISRQAAIKLAIDLDCESRGIIKESKCREIENRYNMIPAAQPQLVRCKDCKLSPWRPIRYSDTAVEFTCCGFTRGPEGFCAWGEKKEEE